MRQAGQRVAGRPGGDDAALGQHDERTAEAGGEVQIVRGDDDRQAALAIQPCEQRGDVELVAEIERRRRLVEQQDLGLLGERAGDDDALLLAARERGEAAALEGERAGGRERLARDGHVARALEFERAEVRDSVPSGRSRARCSRRRDGFPAARPRCDARAPRAGQRREVAPSSVTVPDVRPQHAGQQPQQRRLARAVGAENADDAPALDARR